MTAPPSTPIDAAALEAADAVSPPSAPARRPDSLARALVRARRSPLARRWASPVALAVILTGVADAVTTAMALDTGRAVEVNPIVAAAQAALGPAWVAAKLALHAALAGVTLWWPNGPTLLAMGLLSLIAAAVSAHNMGVYLSVPT